MLKFGIIGLGSRGQMFARLIKNDKNAQLYAVAEPVVHSREKAVKEFGVSAERCYKNAGEFLNAGKICDAIFICTQDADHYQQIMKALEIGYDVCLEKPAAVNIEQCIEIRDKANSLGRNVLLTHVLRYTPFYATIKKYIDGGKLGKVVTMNMTENIAYWHFALSYVRGPWRDMEKSTPTIIAKCCHDLDLAVWLMNRKCVSVSSYGKLYYYNEKNAPTGSAKYCIDCDKKVREKCLYDCFKVYPNRVQASVVGGTSTINPDNVMDVLSSREHVWGRCVFYGDNDAVDNQVVNMSFEDGATAHLTMTAFSDKCYRSIKVHGTEGEIYGNLDDSILYYTKYGEEQQKIDLNETNSGVRLDDGHGGGDYFLYKDFYNLVSGEKTSESRTSIDVSIESHIIGFKAEESRKNCGKPARITSEKEERK